MFKKYKYKIVKKAYTILPWYLYEDNGFLFYDWWFIDSFKTKEEAEDFMIKFQKEKEEVWYY